VNIPNHIFKSLETIFWIKKLKIFDADPDPGCGNFLTQDPGWKYLDLGPGMNIPDPQHC